MGRLGLLLVFLSLGCQDSRRVTIYADGSPELVDLVDMFNRSQEEYRAEFIYDPSHSLGAGKKDVLISPELNVREYKKRFVSLETLEGTPFFQTLYQGVREGIYEKERLKILPLTLDYLVLVGKTLPGEGKYYLLENLQEDAKDFNRITKERLSQQGFSPLWSEDFLKALFYAKVPSPFLIFQEKRPELEALTQELRGWMDTNTGGLTLDRDFNKKYRYIPDYRLVQSGRIGYVSMPLSRWGTLPDEATEELEAKGLLFDYGIQPLYILYAGVLKEGNHKGGIAFLSWLLNFSTWENYLQVTRAYKDDSFGFLHGVSTSEELNRKLLPKYYPWVDEILPQREEFTPIGEVVPQWNALWAQLVYPNILGAVENSAPPRSLPEEYQSWQNLYPDLWSF